MTTVEIKFDEEVVQVRGYQTDGQEGDGRNAPYIPKSFNVREAWYRGIDIYDVMIEMKCAHVIDEKVHEKINQ